ncbi:MAG: adenylosuccinate lyase [Candidatus Marinimicrobia bacterium]|nr:adenylosuccinate lyase [Candidatus Neomarinimicrobiota bacterium]
MSNPENTISPLDGRYAQDVAGLRNYFSEMALMKYRVRIEVEYLIALSREKQVIELPPVSAEDQKKLRSFYQDFSNQDFQAIKRIEEKTKHDVKAVEYFLRRKSTRIGLKSYSEWIHFALTSEDVNNLAYALMWRDALKQVYLPLLTTVHNRLKRFSKRYRDLAMLSLTHGQPATPTSLGKEFAVFANRLNRQLEQLKQHKLQGKLAGATGTWSAHVVAFPQVNWINFSKRFVASLKLEPNLITTQVEDHDSLAESYNILIRINSILLDFCRDVWLYISRGIFGQRIKAGEVGSSTMPHKVNPIYFENAEGNLGIGNTLLSHLAQTLPISRMQRDLSGSTVIRNQGVPLAHSLLACKNILKGLDRLTVNKTKLREELNDHWEVLAEAVQTVLRKIGDSESYEKLEELTRGKKISKENIYAFIEELALPKQDKQALLALTPETYIGLADKIVEELN